MIEEKKRREQKDGPNARMVFPVRFLFAFCVRASAGVPRCVLFFTGDVGLFLAVSSFFFVNRLLWRTAGFLPWGATTTMTRQTTRSPFFCCVSQRKGCRKTRPITKMCKRECEAMAKKGRHDRPSVRRKRARGRAPVSNEKNGDADAWDKPPFFALCFRARQNKKPRPQKEKDLQKKRTE